MSFISLILLGVGVSADAFAAALAIGVRKTRITGRMVLTVGAVFAVFQVLMPLIGWALASSFSTVLAPVDHWIAFVLLGLLGVNMIREALGPDGTSGGPRDRLDMRHLLLLGLATSVDALAVGVSLAVTHVSVAAAVGVIGAVTFLLSAGAVVLGHRAGMRFRRPAEILGGVVLIAIGTRILLEHLGVW
ncbi:manganese efflux pump MntP family protein [uncultured Corynebacterium sp.]|uniref:manganese efflux pump MntP n=1 Tax=uncultured Corynebacterium sp. TaxID=159447 RepID=UPI0025FDBC77|nr:manganese efflux pump MntP family protein [uncultured Corynebacterium sp.]